MATVHRLINFLQKGIWEVRLKDIPPLKAFFLRYLRVLVLAVQGFLKDDCQKRAAVLTYYSLLNVVPVFAVIFGIAKGFGLDRFVEKQILTTAGKANWQPEITTQIIGFSQSLLEHTKGGVIAGVGVVLMLWTVISILTRIEEAFDAIWEVRKPRTLVRKFTDYTAMIVLAPILFIVSGSLTLLLTRYIRVIMQEMAFPGGLGSIVLFALKVLPYVSIWVLLTMLYMVLPNRRIPLKSGMLAGAAAGVLFQAVQWIYITFQIGVASYGAIYGSFAALPLFLVWLQVSWMIVLFGSEFAHAGEHYETFGFHPDYSRLSRASQKILTLRVFHHLATRFVKGEGPSGLSHIAYALEMPLRLVHHILMELSEAGLVTEAEAGNGKDLVYQPRRSVEEMTVQEVIDRYEESGIASLPPEGAAEPDRIAPYLREISQAIKTHQANVKLKDITG
jgi:membrane protein